MSSSSSSSISSSSSAQAALGADGRVDGKRTGKNMNEGATLSPNGDHAKRATSPMHAPPSPKPSEGSSSGQQLSPLKRKRGPSITGEIVLISRSNMISEQGHVQIWYLKYNIHVYHICGYVPLCERFRSCLASRDSVLSSWRNYQI